MLLTNVLTYFCGTRKKGLELMKRVNNTVKLGEGGMFCLYNKIWMLMRDVTQLKGNKPAPVFRQNFNLSTSCIKYQSIVKFKGNFIQLFMRIPKWGLPFLYLLT